MKTEEGNEATEQKPGRDTLPQPVAEALDALLWYLWEAELQDYSENRGEAGEEEHIFHSVVTVDNWFEGGRPVSADEWADDFERCRAPIPTDK